MVAGFPGFARPKTALKPGTERGLTSEFGMGSGGSRALWPATKLVHYGKAKLTFRLLLHEEGIRYIFAEFYLILIVVRGRSLARYDDGLQKAISYGFADLMG